MDPPSSDSHGTPADVDPSVPVKHPPYTEMIIAAISSLDEQNGSSRQAISNYIERVYKDLSPTHSTLLTQGLTKLTNRGHLLKIGSSYKLPESKSSSKTQTTTDLTNNAAASTFVPDGENPPPPPPPTTTTTVTDRRKSLRSSTRAVAIVGEQKKKSPSRRQRAKLGPEKSTTVPTTSSKPRGRPKKDASSSANDKIKQPVARTRKNNAPPVRAPAAGKPLWMVDYAYVKSKLDNVQLRIKEAVNVLKLHLNNENESDILAEAIQELEEISSMDAIGAPSHAVQAIQEQEAATNLDHVNEEKEVS